MKTTHTTTAGKAPQHAGSRLIFGLMLAGSGLLSLRATPPAFAQEESHVMPKGQAMKGPAHLKHESSGMPSGAHAMPKGNVMGASAPMQMNGAMGMGAVQQGGPLQVTLIGAPMVGRSRFEVRVTRNGQPVTDANVSLTMSMPYHKHGASFKKLDSMDLVYGQYVGTARTPMVGIYDALVSVKAGGDKQTASYRFANGRKAAVAHLGMWHPAGGFEVRLTTDPQQPTEGPNRFLVQVTREGYPVTDADVGIHVTMPGMSRMGSAASYTKLTPENGSYAGTANLHLAGGQQAHITVKSGGAKGTATYDFPAVGK